MAGSVLAKRMRLKPGMRAAVINAPQGYLKEHGPLPESLLWISFPKASSKIQTDLTRDKGWEALEHVDLKWVTLNSVNETWSAFAFRPYRPGETRQSL